MSTAGYKAFRIDSHPGCLPQQRHEQRRHCGEGRESMEYNIDWGISSHGEEYTIMKESDKSVFVEQDMSGRR